MHTTKLLKYFHEIQGLNSNAGGGIELWVEQSCNFEPTVSISIFIPWVIESQFINSYTIIGKIYCPN